MPFEYNFSRNNINKVESTNKEPVEKTQERYSNLLVNSIDQFRLIRASRKPENKLFVESVENKVEKLTNNARENIFNQIISERKEGVENWRDAIYEEKIKSLLNYDESEEKKFLIDLDDNSIGNVLKPLDKEIRENLYVTRDKVDLERLKKVSEKRMQDTDIVFHVSPYEIKDEIKKGEKKNSDEHIYVSSDLERLFNLKEAKYIYALRVNKNSMKRSQYCAVDCFHKLRDGSEGYSIVDRIKIFDEKDPAYREKVLKSLGAKFYKNYLSSTDHASEAMRNFDEDRFTL